jgi:lactoylglutathione lyase
MIKGLFETHLYVRDLQQSVVFYRDVLGMEYCYEDRERKIVFFWIGAPRKAMLGLWQMPEEKIQPRHFAFECDADWVLAEAVPFLKERNIACFNFLKDGSEQPMVFAWMPAVAVYFNDPDGHVLEFIGILNGNSLPHLGVVPYDVWINAAKNS